MGGISCIKKKLKEDKTSEFREDKGEVLWFKDRLVVPKVPALKQQIMNETHLSRCSIQSVS